MMWTKHPYGTDDSLQRGGCWNISNDHIGFDIHWTVDGSGKGGNHPGGYIVLPAEADEYATKIVDALNTTKVQLGEQP